MKLCLLELCPRLYTAILAAEYVRQCDSLVGTKYLALSCLSTFFPNNKISRETLERWVTYSDKVILVSCWFHNSSDIE